MSEPRQQRSKDRTPSFTCELPLRATPRTVRAVLVRLDVGRQLYNTCLQVALIRLRELRASPEWTTARALPKQTAEHRTRRGRAFTCACKRYGFTDYALQHVALKHFRRSKWMCEHLGTHEVQKVGTRAFRAAERVLFGTSTRARFKPCGRFRSLEGKSNTTGIRWRTNRVEWHGLVLHAIIPRCDQVVEHALEHRVKYARLVLRRLRGIPRLYAQLVCEGRPYRKPRHTIGRGHVGLDFGPSTIALAGDKDAVLAQFCEDVVRDHRKIRVLHRHLDRQRRANNPGNYLADGQVKPGAKVWRLLHRERETITRFAELHRREAAHRTSLHGRLANTTLTMGRWIHKEDISPKALQRRYGRSTGLRAPGLFLSIIRRKAESAGGGVIDIPARTAKLSQTCHQCGAVHQKPLRQRVHACGCGVIAQRDLYSAFLARHTNAEGQLHAGQARRAWPGAEALLRAAWSKATQPANGRRKPATFGTLPWAWSQSGSLAQEGIANTEARCANAPGEVAVVPLRTPGL